MAKKKNKKNLMKEQMLKLKQEALALRQGKQTKEQQAMTDRYGRIKDEEKFIDHKFTNGLRLTEEEVMNLGPMSPRHAARHGISTSNRVNMLQDFAVRKINHINQMEKYIENLKKTLTHERKQLVKRRKKAHKEPNKLQRLMSKGREI